MPDIDYWKPLLEKRNFVQSKEHVKTDGHACNSFQWLLLKQTCANDDNRMCDFKITILAYDIIKIECFAYRDFYWETCFFGKIHSAKHYDLLMDMFIGHVEYVENKEETDTINILLDIYLENRAIKNI